MVGNKQIEIDEKEIRIMSKNGTQKEIIKLANVDKLMIKGKGWDMKLNG